MAYELTGKIKLIQDPRTFDSGFTKREMVVIVENGKYPQEINLEFVQDKVSLLESLEVGQEVTVTFDILGREYNGRYHNNLLGRNVVVNSGSELRYDRDQQIPRTTEIENCTLYYRCPNKWYHLQRTESEDIRFCAECNQNVYYCSNADDLARAINKKQCVAIPAGIDSGDREDLLVGIPF